MPFYFERKRAGSIAYSRRLFWSPVQDAAQGSFLAPQKRSCEPASVEGFLNAAAIDVDDGESKVKTNSEPV